MLDWTVLKFQVNERLVEGGGGRGWGMETVLHFWIMTLRKKKVYYCYINSFLVELCLRVVTTQSTFALKLFIAIA